MKVNKNSKHEVIAALKLDRHSFKLAKVAGVLAARSGKSLRLVHVFSAETTSNELQFEQTESDLKDIATQLSYLGIRVSTTVLIGSFPESILELSAAHCGSLLVAGSEKTESGFFHSRLRDTYHLMAGSELPVLIIPESSPLALGTERPIRILVADDLSEAAQDSLDCVSSIIRNFNLKTSVVHTHVEPTSTATLVLSPSFELELWPGIEVKERQLNKRHEVIKTKMAKRSEELRQSIEEAGGDYHFELWHGNVAEELKRAVDVHKSDITVFGKHHFIHASPLAVGQMPYKNMIDLDGAILVAPEKRLSSPA